MNTECNFLLRCLLPVGLVLLLLLAGCTATNISKVMPPIISQLKEDPATVKFTVIAPGVTVQFERSWPTNFVPPVPKPPTP